MDIATIGIAVDTRQIKGADRELDNLGRTGQKVENSLNKSTKSITDEFGGMKRAIDAAKATLVGIGLIQVSRQAIQYADASKQVNNQLRQVSDSEGELLRVRQQLLGISNDTNAELGATVSLYSEMTRATLDLGVSQQEVANVTETINNLFKAGGKGANETAGAIRQLSQGLASGALRGDEFNSVAENAPRILDAIALSTGKARGELREFAADGGITSELLITALKEYQVEAQRLADLTEETFGQKMVVARNNAIEQAGAMGSLNVAINTLGDGVVLLSENLDTLVDVVTIGGVIIGARFAGSVGLATAAIISAQAQTMRYVTATATLNGASRTAAVGQAALATSVRGASAAMGLLGGPVGVAIIAAAGLYAFREELGLVDTAARDTERAIDELGNEITDLDRKATMANISSLESALVDLQRQAQESKKSVSETLSTEKQGNSVLGFSMDMSGMKAAAKENKELGDSISFVEKAIEQFKERLVELDNEEGRRAKSKKSQMDAEEKKLRENIQLLRDQQALVSEGMTVEDAAFAAQFNHATALEREQMLLQDSLQRTKEKQDAVTKAAEDAAKAAEDRQREFSQVAQSLLNEEELIKQSYERRRQIIVDNTEMGSMARRELLTRLETETNEQLLALNGTFWERYLLAAQEALSNVDDLAVSTIETFSSGMGDALESIVFDFQSLGDAFDTIVESMARNMINALGKMAAEWLVYQAVQMLVGKTTASAGATAMAANAQAAAFQAGINAFSSTAAIPIVGPPAAPAAMAAALAATQPLASSVAALASASFAGAFDDGGYIPAGKYGLAGEYGPEFVNGPAQITSREDTMKMVKNAGQPAANSDVNLRIVNVTDMSQVENYLGSDAGERIIMNAASRNPEFFQRIARGG